MLHLQAGSILRRAGVQAAKQEARGRLINSMAEVPEAIRPCRKLLRAVADLHVRGYQRLRVVPYLYDLGSWRCALIPAIYVSRTHGARWVQDVPQDGVAVYSSASDSEYWGWQDKRHCSPAELAEVLLARLPTIARLSYGVDWLYAGWYQHMLHLTYPDALPIAWSDQGGAETNSCMRMLGRDGVIPLPPPGHAAQDAAE